MFCKVLWDVGTNFLLLRVLFQSNGPANLQHFVQTLYSIYSIISCFKYDICYKIILNTMLNW